MFGSGAGRDRINSRVLVIISSKSDNGLDGGLYTRIIIRSGLSIFYNEYRYIIKSINIEFKFQKKHSN